MDKPKRIAIIGGGISGLAAAYAITEIDNSLCKVKVFEADSQLGGNAATFDVNLGDRLAWPGGPLTRWCDLGVNDFNRTRYLNTVAIMDRIGMTPGVDYRLLESSECYYKFDGSIIYTDERELYHGTTRQDLKLPSAMIDEFNKLMVDMGTNFRDVDPERELPNTISLDDYLKDYEKRVPGPTRKDYYAMRDYMLFPRVAAMYFTVPTGPWNLPAVSLFEYYAIQEGYGQTAKHQRPPERMYFIGGSRAWLEKLADWLETHRDVVIKRNFRAQVTPCAEGVKVADASGAREEEHFDVVVMSCHADDAVGAIDDSEAPNPDALAAAKTLLSKVSYGRAEGIAHTYAGILPGDVNAWRSYNVVIRDRSVKNQEYSMTYVENRHQNDFLAEADPTYRNFGMPFIFITLNPQIEIPDRYVLRLSDIHGEARGGYFTDSYDTSDDQVRAQFKHNILNADGWKVQHEIHNFQGPNNLYFTGGWTKFAGLQEHCVMMGQTVAKTIFDSEHVDEHGHGFISTLHRG